MRSYTYDVSFRATQSTIQKSRLSKAHTRTLTEVFQ